LPAPPATSAVLTSGGVGAGNSGVPAHTAETHVRRPAATATHAGAAGGVAFAEIGAGISAVAPTRPSASSAPKTKREERTEADVGLLRCTASRSRSAGHSTDRDQVSKRG